MSQREFVHYDGFKVRVLIAVHYVRSFTVVLRYLHNSDCDVHEFVGIMQCVWCACCIDQCTYYESLHIIPVTVIGDGDQYIIFRQAHAPSWMEMVAMFM